MTTAQCCNLPKFLNDQQLIVFHMFIKKTACRQKGTRSLCKLLCQCELQNTRMRMC